MIQFKCAIILDYQAETPILTDMTSLLQQMCNLLSFGLFFPYRYGVPELTAEEICSMIPSHLRHFE
ncbi:unnamed protein product, partial [Rotaria sp. Silwood1]